MTCCDFGWRHGRRRKNSVRTVRAMICTILAHRFCSTDHGRLRAFLSGYREETSPNSTLHYKTARLKAASNKIHSLSLTGASAKTDLVTTGEEDHHLVVLDLDAARLGRRIGVLDLHAQRRGRKTPQLLACREVVHVGEGETIPVQHVGSGFSGPTPRLLVRV